MMQKAKTKAIRNDMVAIKQLVNFAAQCRMIRENPLAELKLPQPTRMLQAFWSRAQVEKNLKASSINYRLLFHFLADTRTRFGEARWPTWDDVNFENKVIHIRPKEGWRPKNR